MMGRSRWAAIAAILVLAGCASRAPTVKPNAGIEVAVRPGQRGPDPDAQIVIEGVRMIQAAIDGPFDDVVRHYEAQYGASKSRIYSARGMTDSLLI